jgi:hypothetical protein
MPNAKEQMIRRVSDEYLVEEAAWLRLYELGLVATPEVISGLKDLARGVLKDTKMAGIRPYGKK